MGLRIYLKRRKGHKKLLRKIHASQAFNLVVHDVFLDLKFGRAKVDQQSMLDTGGRYSPIVLPSPRAAAQALDRMAWYAEYRSSTTTP